MLRRCLALLLLILLPAAAAADPAASPQVRMELFSELENLLLLERNGLLDDEAAAEDPIWIRSMEGPAIVVDGARIAHQMRGLALIIEQAGIADAIVQTLPLGQQLLAGMAPADIRNEALIQRQLDGFRGRSAEVRANALADLDLLIAGTRAAFQVALAERDALIAPAPEVPPDLAGSWRGCDGRIVTFSGGGGIYEGRYTALGGLGQFGFAPGEVGYRVRATGAAGAYAGEVLWKETGGRNPRWVPTTITVSGATYHDTGADGCSRTMTRVE